jgi:hypothetical protein
MFLLLCLIEFAFNFNCSVFYFSEYENLAMRLLQCLYSSNPHMTRLALKRENFEFNKLSSLEVASMFRIVSRPKKYIQ